MATTRRAGWGPIPRSLRWRISFVSLLVLLVLLLLCTSPSFELVAAASAKKNSRSRAQTNDSNSNKKPRASPTTTTRTSRRSNSHYYPPSPFPLTSPFAPTASFHVHCIPSHDGSAKRRMTPERGAETTARSSTRADDDDDDGFSSLNGRGHDAESPSASHSSSPPLFVLPSTLFSHGGSLLDDPLYGAPLTGYREEALRTSGVAELTCFLPLASPSSSSSSSSFSSSAHRTTEPSHLTLLLGPHTPALQSPLYDPLPLYFRNFTYSFRLLHHDHDSREEEAFDDLDNREEEEDPAEASIPSYLRFRSHASAAAGGEGCSASHRIRAMFFHRNRSSASSSLFSASSSSSYATPSVLYSFDRIRYTTVGGADDDTPQRVAREEYLYGIPSGRSCTPTTTAESGWGGRPKSSRRSGEKKANVAYKEPHPPYWVHSIFLRLWFWGYERLFQRILVDAVGQYSWFSSSPYFVTSIVDALQPVKVSLSTGSWRRFWQLRTVEVKFTVREWAVPKARSYRDSGRHDSYDDFDDESSYEGDARRWRSSNAARSGHQPLLMPLPSDVMREGRENTLHILSFPPVARKRKTTSKTQEQKSFLLRSVRWLSPFRRWMAAAAQGNEEEELVCDYGAIKDARHHFLYDPIVFINNQATTSRSEERTADEHADAAKKETESADENGGSLVDDADDFFAELLGLVEEEERGGGGESTAQRQRRKQKMRDNQKALQKPEAGRHGFAAPYGSFSSSGSSSSSSSFSASLVPEVANVFLFPLRFVMAALWGTGGAEPNGFLASLLPPRGLVNVLWSGGGNMDLDPTRAGGFSMSASQLAAKQYLGGVVAELGPAATSASQRKPWPTATRFSKTEHFVTSEFYGDETDDENDDETEAEAEDGMSSQRNGEDHYNDDDEEVFSLGGSSRHGGAFTKFVYRWQASLPATHAVCLSVAPTEYTKYSRGASVGSASSTSATPVFAVEVTERIGLDRTVLRVLAVFLVLGWVKKPLFARYSRFLQAVLAGVCGVVFLLLVGVYYLFRQFPKMKLWKTGLYVLLTVGGVAAVFDLLTHSFRYVIAELDATYVDWRFYAFAVVACIGFVSSLLLRQMLSTAVLGSLTEHSFDGCRVVLLVWAIWTHPEATLASGILLAVIQGSLWCFLMLLWLRYDPKLEEEKAILRRHRLRRSAGLPCTTSDHDRAATGVSQQDRGRRGSSGNGIRLSTQAEEEEEQENQRYREIQSRHSGGRRSSGLLSSVLNAQQLGNEGLLSALHRRWTHRAETWKHYTWRRVLLRFLRRCSLLLLSVMRHAVEDMDSEDDDGGRGSSSSEGFRPSSSRASGRFVDVPAGEGRGSAGVVDDDDNSHGGRRRFASCRSGDETFLSPSISPPPVDQQYGGGGDGFRHHPHRQQRRQSSLSLVSAAVLSPLIERWAEAQERWKHPQRYHQYNSGDRFRRSRHDKEGDEENEIADPREVVLRKSRELQQQREKQRTRGGSGRNSFLLRGQRWWPWGGTSAAAYGGSARGSDGSSASRASYGVNHLDEVLRRGVEETDTDSESLLEDQYYSSDSDVDSLTSEEGVDLLGRHRRRRTPRELEAAFQKQLNDPLDVFPEHVYREAPRPSRARGAGSGRRGIGAGGALPMREEEYRSQVNAYTKSQLKQLATNIRARHDLSDLSRRLHSPNRVMRWARDTAPTFDELKH